MWEKTNCTKPSFRWYNWSLWTKTTRELRLKSFLLNIRTCHLKVGGVINNLMHRIPLKYQILLKPSIHLISSYVGNTLTTDSNNISLVIDWVLEWTLPLISPRVGFMGSRSFLPLVYPVGCWTVELLSVKWFTLQRWFKTQLVQVWEWSWYSDFDIDPNNTFSDKQFHQTYFNENKILYTEM